MLNQRAEINFLYTVVHLSQIYISIFVIEVTYYFAGLF